MVIKRKTRRAICLEKCAFLSPRKQVVSCGCQLDIISIWRPIKCVIRSIRTSFKDVDFENRIAFKDEVQNALHLLVEKHRVGTGSIQEVLCSQIAARDIMLEANRALDSNNKKEVDPTNESAQSLADSNNNNDRCVEIV